MGGRRSSAVVAGRQGVDEIAGAEIAVKGLRRQERERGVERVGVCVDIGDEPVAHERSLSLRLTSTQNCEAPVFPGWRYP
jgi:hypothetical protein